MLIALKQGQLDDLAPIAADGSMNVDTDILAAILIKALEVPFVRLAVSSADYDQHDDGTPEPATRAITGIWWLSHGDDRALIGGFIIEGRALTISTEGEGESPLAEGIDILDRATGAIASQYPGSEVVDTGSVRARLPAEMKPVRVVVTRDYRIRRPQDVLSLNQCRELKAGRLGLAIVQVIGGDKALVMKHGV